MSLAMKIQLAIVGTVAVIGIVVAVVGLIRVIPEINQIVRDAALEDEKNSCDGNHD